ncbi:VCBS repeat-containing protein [Nostoc commune NIES-4072]|uniref:chitinase n=1 Tax=Nostoc commune NIES-4072 TaxID=2005467 RepID=A0A2R5FJI9_NOSCO|nr:glycosyl hydrolase family 18 protein [Nostoc commune]GBG18942.1 VCBS repeat-containing protein [Nostoc commune NIES-4072]
MYGIKKLAIKKFSLLQKWTNFWKFTRQVADVNGDGRTDIVAFGCDAVYVSLGQSNGTFGQAFTGITDSFTINQGEWTSFDKYPRQLADVNGDGRADIVGFGYDNVFVSLGQSNGTFGPTSVAKNDDFTVNKGGWTSFDKYPRQLADVNGDGRADIVGFGYDNVFVSLGQSNGTFGPTSVAKNDDFTVNKGDRNNFDHKPRQLGDVNGDGKADIIGFAQDGTYVALANNQTTPPPMNNQYVVAGYLPSWGISSTTNPATIPVNKLTHLFYAFADVDTEGNVKLSPDGQDGDINVLKSLKAQNPKLKILVSIGGAGENDFSSAASTAQSRIFFAQSAINFMKNNGFDGIDIDWEFPKKEENSNYIQLLSELRQELNNASTTDGNKYLLTTALSGSPYQLSPSDYADAPYDLNSTVLKTTSEYVDFINLMTYDYHGSWENTTNHQAALYKSSSDQSYNSDKLNADWSVKKYLSAGVEAKDIVLGVPLYSPTWAGVKAGSNNDGLFQSATSANDPLLYKDIHAQVGTDGYQYNWDDSAKVPYIYNSQKQEFSTYEDKRSVLEKVNYVEQQGLGGIFFWQLIGDLPITHSDSLVNVAAANLL